MKRKIFAAFIAVTMLFGILPFTTAVSAESPSVVSAASPAVNRPESNGNILRMWYTKPASVVLTESNRSWQRETLPIGNGYMGGLVFGGISRERVHFNEKTTWAGGPGTKLNSQGQPTTYSYFFGNRGRKNPTSGTVAYPVVTGEYLENLRKSLDDKSTNVFGLPQTTSAQRNATINGVLGEINGFEYYMDFGDIYLDFAKSGITDAAVTNYVRDLDMRTAVSSVDFDYDGVHYSREYFVSYPDNVMVMRLTASEPGKLTFDASMAVSGTATLASSRKFESEGDMMSMKAKFTSNSLNVQANAKVLNEGGTIAANADGTLSVNGADAVTILFACGTNYKNEYPVYRGEDPNEVIVGRLTEASKKSYDDLKQTHLDDYCPLFSRVELDLDAKCPEIPTDQLVKNYRAGIYDRALEVMTFQFGRYFTIAGSREGALPTNLQGVWGIGTFTWYGDYHFNINLEMNYWPTLSTNLAECQLPLNDFIESLRKPGRINAATATAVVEDQLKNISNIEDLSELDSIIDQPIGWLIHCFTNSFGYSGNNQGNQPAGWNPSGSAWILQNVYDYYRYTGDVEYLRTNIYPAMKEVADFWTKFLWWSPYQQRYTVAPSVSPENGPTAIGTTYDQSLVWQLFEETCQAAEILGVDADRVEVWRDFQSKLNPIIVGDDGQVKEWFEETTIGRAQAGDLPEIDIPNWRDSLGAGAVPHRHASHLLGLYPGTLISKDNPTYMDAAKISLNERGPLGTAWAKAHKISLWARTLQAEETYALVRSMLAGGNAGILENLFDSHGGGANYLDYPIFQIDGNFGFTAGVTEMLLQSQLGYTQFLPAIPAEWANGSVKGLVARGNFVVDMKWSGGKADEFKVTARNGGTFIGEYKDIASKIIVDSEGNVVTPTIISQDKISFETVLGRTYTITNKEDEVAADPVRLWYTYPAPAVSGKNWQSNVLPIGNGYMGGMIFGSIVREQVHINEKSLWTGGPSPTRTPEIYNSGNRKTQATTEFLNEFRSKLDDKSNNIWGLAYGAESNYYLINQLMYGGERTSPYIGMGTYQDFGDVYLDFAKSGITANAVTNYVRDLDIANAVASVSYDFDGVNYKREYFNSYPDNVLAMRLTASEVGKLTFDASIAPYTPGKTGASTVAAGDTITYKATITDNTLKCEAQVKVINKGGSLVANANGTISVTGADEVVIILACGTNYKNEYPNYRGEDPHDAITNRIAVASAKGYNELKKTHINDYNPLFARVKLDLGEIPNIPTNELVANYQKGDYNTALEALVYQYGRYLAIASSRQGCLPPNLVGVWQIGGAVWNGDYHFNENFQMNYWPMLASNLAECAEPLNDFMESLREPGRVAAGASMGSPSGPGEANGFLIHTATNIFGLSGPYQAQEFGWNVGGVSWSLQNVYDYYKFTGDKEYLRDKIYPMLKEQATFYNNILWWSDYQQRLVVGPSHSPEQGPTVNGSTYDQSVAWEAFKEAIEVSEILGVDADLRAEWSAKQAQLNPVIIGTQGQVKEWFEETSIGRAQAGDLPEEAIPNFNAGHPGIPHRHISHLVGLYPGTLISKETPEYLEAAKVSIEKRGLVSTGWGKAHRINALARTGDAEKTYEMVRALIGGNYSGIMANLWDSHGGYNSSALNYTSYEYQIDGNFGYTAGVNEMLVQSQLGYVQFLPAVPQAWKTGNVKGLVARGNFELDMDWSEGHANFFKVKARNGGTFIGEYKDIATATIVDSQGNVVTPMIISQDKISFETVLNETYTITMPLVKSISPATITGGYDANVSVKLVADAIAFEGSELYLDFNGEEIGAGVISDCEGILKIKNAPNVAGTYGVYAKTGEGSIKLGDISITEKPTDIWTPSISADPDTGNLVIEFASPIQLKPYSVVNIAGVDYKIINATSTTLTCDFAAENLSSGDLIKITGVKFPSLFPSYSFTISFIK